MVSWSFTSCFSANVSAASLFENVATTGPLASPRLTSNLAPSWVTTYVLMPSVWHGPSHAPSGTVYESFSAYVGGSSRRPHPSPDSPGAVPLRTSRRGARTTMWGSVWCSTRNAVTRDQRHRDRRSTAQPIVTRPPFTVTATVSWPSGRSTLGEPSGNHDHNNGSSRPTGLCSRCPHG
jgi:hypothetical protein